MSRGKMHIVLAGGGTAGHTSPLIATAEVLQSYPDTTVSAVGTPKGIEGRVIPEAGLELDMIAPAAIPRSLSPQLFKVPGVLAKAVRQAKEILLKRNTDVVIGFGGYVSAPVYLAAKKLHIPIVVHEQNVLPGLANRLGKWLGGAVAISFENTPLAKAQYIGLPLRRQISRLADLSAESRQVERECARHGFGLSQERPTLLVSGGSQGARSINEALMKIVPRLLAENIDIIHVWGAKNFSDQSAITLPQTGATYVPVAYVSQMSQAYLASDLMLGRSGAGTVIETAVAGIPAIFVPLPIGNGEQARNAASLVKAGAAELMADADLADTKALQEKITALLLDPAQLAKMRAIAGKLIPGDAAEKLARLALSQTPQPDGGKSSGGAK